MFFTRFLFLSHIPTAIYILLFPLPPLSFLSLLLPRFFLSFFFSITSFSFTSLFHCLLLPLIIFSSVFCFPLFLSYLSSHRLINSLKPPPSPPLSAQSPPVHPSLALSFSYFYHSPSFSPLLFSDHRILLSPLSAQSPPFPPPSSPSFMYFPPLFPSPPLPPPLPRPTPSSPTFPLLFFSGHRFFPPSTLPSPVPLVTPSLPSFTLSPPFSSPFLFRSSPFSSISASSSSFSGIFCTSTRSSSLTSLFTLLSHTFSSPFSLAFFSNRFFFFFSLFLISPFPILSHTFRLPLSLPSFQSSLSFFSNFSLSTHLHPLPLSLSFFPVIAFTPFRLSSPPLSLSFFSSQSQPSPPSFAYPLPLFPSPSFSVKFLPFPPSPPSFRSSLSFFSNFSLSNPHLPLAYPLPLLSVSAFFLL
ncbi:hypothetical protein C7M84_006794 [Penaeus vannamei]|uniref:Uncharacterized protein n=1 Tax=Penaeus vannamei TaxID=6689 RepID=A0A3R7M708_PENVA|nr:hypothetical protein C7M84_006794 [Penaeus vannamei]